MAANNSPNKWRWWHGVALGLLLIIMGLGGWRVVCNHPIVSWLLSLASLFALVMVIGCGLTGLWRGVFIDERNMISLSRFQMVIWTCLVLGTYGNIVASNIDYACSGNPTIQGNVTTQLNNISSDPKNDERKKLEGYYNRIKQNPSDVAIPNELLALMGISMFSLAASPLIRQTNGPKPETVDPGSNPTPAASSFADMFNGGYIQKYTGTDLGKIQMFVFTIVLVMIYGLNLAKLLNRQLPIWEFPAISESMVTLLAISHAGYLSVKTVAATTKKDTLVAGQAPPPAAQAAPPAAQTVAPAAQTVAPSAQTVAPAGPTPGPSGQAGS